MIVLYCLLGYSVVGFILSSLFIKYRDNLHYFVWDDFWFFIAFWPVLVFMFVGHLFFKITSPLKSITEKWINYLRK